MKIILIIITILLLLLFCEKIKDFEYLTDYNRKLIGIRPKFYELIQAPVHSDSIARNNKNGDHGPLEVALESERSIFGQILFFFCSYSI